MKKAVYIIVMAAAWYIAGMYRLFPFMVLAVAQVMAFFVMLIVSRYLRGGVFAAPAGTVVEAERGAGCGIPVDVENRRKISAARFTIRMKVRYRGEKRGKTERFTGNISAESRIRILVPVHTPHCGVLKAEPEEMKVYDPLSLFGAKGSFDGAVDVVVFPVKRRTNIVFEEPYPGLSRGGESTGRDGKAAEYGDVKFLREYREGDSSRAIHWKQSARTDTLWVREYEPEPERHTELRLDPWGKKDSGEMIPDAFYEILYALLCGLAENGCSVTVRWTTPAGKPSSYWISDDDSAKRMLCELFADDAAAWRENRDGEEAENTVSEANRAKKEKSRAYSRSRAKKEKSQVYSGSRAHTGNSAGAEPEYILDGSLRLMRGSETVFCFSPDLYEEELERVTLYL